MSAIPTNDHVAMYVRMQIETASQPRLICMLHNHCILQLRQSVTFNQSSRRSYLDKAQNIIILLQRSLKKTDATSASLFHLYDYCYCLLENDSTSSICNVLSVIDSLRATFTQLQKHPE